MERNLRIICLWMFTLPRYFYPESKELEVRPDCCRSFIHDNCWVIIDSWGYGNLTQDMNVLFVPTLGLDLSLIERLANSVDYHIRSKVIFNNGEPGACDEFRDRHDDWQV